ncbi:MAG TPA: LacI family transcriptional regulator [Hydrogenispora sp.]|jgi:LacI family transcriptional regulator|nr:LacI family transcriptional regulator [Hydrogenispora sp.]
MIVTIRDVAKKAGYSITTVSRALNGFDDVNEETRAKIMAVAKELNYQPNRVARSLVTKTVNTIGLFVLGRSSFQQGFIADLVSGLIDEASTHDFDLLIFGTQSLKAGLPFQQLCHQRGVGGAVITGLKITDPIIAELEDSPFPTVLIDVPINGPKATYVTFDNQKGMVQALDHLYDLGHRKIGFINGHLEAWVCRERLAGYKKGLAKHGLTYNKAYVYNGNFSKESGRAGAKELIKKNPELTALMVASDLMAAGALEELTAMGYALPEDLSLVGFDDQTFAALTSPALTTIKQDEYLLGRLAAENIIKLINDPGYLPEIKTLTTNLVIRQSTGPVKS